MYSISKMIPNMVINKNEKCLLMVVFAFNYSFADKYLILKVFEPAAVILRNPPAIQGCTFNA